MKLIIKNLSAFKNFEGEIGVVIPNSQNGLSHKVLWFSDDNYEVVNENKLDDVHEHHLIEELEENIDLFNFAVSQDIIEEDRVDFVNFINYSTEFNLKLMFKNENTPNYVYNYFVNGKSFWSPSVDLAFSRTDKLIVIYRDGEAVEKYEKS